MARSKTKRKAESYTNRVYRELGCEPGLIVSTVRIQETDLHIQADTEVVVKASELVILYRTQLENYVAKRPHFLTSLVPISDDLHAPPLVRKMIQAAASAEVGPMAAVAGTIAELVGQQLLKDGCSEVVVENGGDIFLHRKQEATVAIFAGESPLSYKIGIKLAEDQLPMGICTSSGSIGHSLSFGEADSVTVVATSTALADAAATRLGNEVGLASAGKAGVEKALEISREIDGIAGVVIVCGDIMGAVGDVNLVKIGEG